MVGLKERRDVIEGGKDLGNAEVEFGREREKYRPCHLRAIC